MSVRALVVRSGENPFPFAPGPLSVEIVEKVSHSIEPLREGVEQLDSAADLAIFTSQVAVRRLSDEDLVSFRHWFADYGPALWDRQLVSDVRAGRLDRLYLPVGWSGLDWKSRSSDGTQKLRGFWIKSCRWRASRR